MSTHLHPGNGQALQGPVDKFTDAAADVQYQFIGEEHMFTALCDLYPRTPDARRQRPRTDLLAEHPQQLKTLKLTGEYYYQRKIGGTVGYFSTTGSTDALLYTPAPVTGSANNGPDTNGYILEVNYLPWLNTKLQLQYRRLQQVQRSKDQLRRQRPQRQQQQHHVPVGVAQLLIRSMGSGKAMKLHYVVALAVSAGVSLGGMARGADIAAIPLTEAQKSALQKTIDTCGTCHGVDGRSVSPTFPNLAAQPAPYIELQLNAFKDQTRADPDAQAYMWGMASQLSDTMISALAGYFAAQAAAPGKPGNPALIAQGKRVFEAGRAGAARFPRVRPATARTPKAWPLFRAWPGSTRRICSGSCW